MRSGVSHDVVVVKHLAVLDERDDADSFICTGVGSRILAYGNALSLVVAGEAPPTQTIWFWFCSKRYLAMDGTDCPFCSL